MLDEATTRDAKLRTLKPLVSPLFPCPKECSSDISMDFKDVIELARSPKVSRVDENDLYKATWKFIDVAFGDGILDRKTFRAIDTLCREGGFKGGFADAIDACKFEYPV